MVYPSLNQLGAYLQPFAPMKGCTTETGMKSRPFNLRTIKVR